MSLGKSVTLTWNAPDDDGGCKIGNYVVEYFRIGWDVWLKASSTRQLTTTLNDLIEGSEYKFRVKAESPYGLSEPSEESQILFIPDPKRGIIAPTATERKVRAGSRQSTLSPQIERRILPDNQYNHITKNSSINQIIIADLPKNVEFISQIYDNEQIVNELNYGTNADDRNRTKETATSQQQTLNLNSNNLIETDLDKIQTNDNESEPKQLQQAEEPPQKEQMACEVINSDNEIHTSNEYMLVLYDDKKDKKTDDEKNHFDLDLKEAIEAPPLSLSTPDLHDLSLHNPFQPLRRSASSSELLYEKVMQRFYQAVELDEAEIARKRSQSVEPSSNKKLKSLEQTLQIKEHLSLSALDKKLPAASERIDREPAIESDHSDWELEEDRDLRKEIIDSLQKRHRTPREPLPDTTTYDDDYTESTASSNSVSISASVESIEQFKNSVRSATSNTNANANTANVRTPVNDELETYHPRMEVRALSPYRSPEPGQATVILNKPVPLPDPDIKPKSILKRRPSNENNTNDITKAAFEKEKEIEIEKESREIQIQQQQQLEQEQQQQLLEQQQKQQQQQQQQQQQLLKQQLQEFELQQQQKRQLDLQQQQLETQQQLQDHQSQMHQKYQQPIQQQQQQQQEQQPDQPPQPPPKKSKSKKANSLPTSPKPEKEKRGFLNLFSKKTTSIENIKKQDEPPIPPIVIENQVIEKATEKEKVLKTRQSSVEENKVEQVAVIDHYSDMMREIGKNPRRKSSVPLYMDSWALQEAAEKAEREERQALARQSRERSVEVNKININEDEDPQYMLEVAKKMNSYTESNEEPLPPKNDLVEISVEHTKSVSYAVRQIKHSDVTANDEPPMVFHADSTSMTQSRKLSNEMDGNHSVIDETKQETITKVRSSSRSRQLGRKSISERRSQSKSPVTERKTSLSTTVLKVTRMPIENSNSDVSIDLEQPADSRTPSPSPTPEPRCETRTNASRRCNIK